MTFRLLSLVLLFASLCTAVTRVQSAICDGTDCTATFGAPPAQGNLITVFALDRSGNSHTGMSISGSGWTKDVGSPEDDGVSRDVLISDLSYRRAQVCWWKIAGSSEPTGITVSGGTVRVMIQEFALEAGEDTFIRSGGQSRDNGATDSEDVTTQTSGTTASIDAPKLVITYWGHRNDANVDGFSNTLSWSNNVANGITSGFQVNNGRAVASGFKTEAANQTEESTGTLTQNTADNTGNSGINAAIQVFELTSGAAPQVIIIQ